MNITTRLVLQHFLSVQLEKSKKSKSEKLDSFFGDFFTREELDKMIQFKYGDNAKGHLKVVRFDKTHLLDFLSDADVLSYFLEQWSVEIETNKSITSIEVYRTLDQLGLHTHYLMSKAIAFWDEYDFSNYRVLSGKAGKVYTIYGIYDADVKSEDVQQVTTHPKRFYETYDKAKTEMEALIHYGKLKKDEVHVLSLLVGDA